ncbi:hypothetical protein KP509_16G051100 [Ceratopteris richardii]|uniref:Peptidase A1 domain-containing protein n=1 Tax=Ceratopteris richardii TaxID=49495 RepID=A0A8T2T2F3_CERRI|nr:hypothetical protein KP509_16G051100 [Ceratopteris richardii]
MFNGSLKSWLYLLNLNVGTPAQKLQVLLDAQSPFTTLHCSNASLDSSDSFNASISSTFMSSSLSPGLCRAASPPTVVDMSSCTCAEDRVSLYVQRTEFPDPLVYSNVSNVSFTCCADTGGGSASASGAAGVAGLSREDSSLLSQISMSSGITRQFSYCLPSIAFFGNVTKYAILNAPVGRIETFAPPTLQTRLYYASGGYAFHLLNISIDGGGIAGVMKRPTKMRVSTTQRFTTLPRSAYKAFRESFRKAIGYGDAVKKVKSIPPFDTCFDTTLMYQEGQSPYLRKPVISTVVQGGGGWQWYPRNTFVYNGTNSLVACMAFLIAEPRQPSVLGTFQQLDCLAQFDVQRSRFGFQSIFNPNVDRPESPRCDNLKYPLYP